MKGGRAIGIGLLLVLVACASPAASASPAESPSEAPTAAATGRTPRTTPVPEPCPSGELCHGLTDPGQYSSDVIEGATITLTLQSTWDADVHPGDEYLNLYHQGDVPAIIGIATFSGEVFTDPCDDQTTSEIDRTPQGLIDWLGQHPAIEIGEPEEATLGEATGLRVELTATKGEPCPAAGAVAPDVILLWPLSDVSVFLLADSTTAILYALELDEKLMIVTAETIFDPVEWRPVVQPVLDSILFAAD